MNTENYEELYEKIYYRFKNKDLLTAALSHPSLCYSKKNKCINYERLELLGDSVLSLIVLDILLTYYKNFDEGEIAKRKSYLVCTDALSKIGKSIDLGKYIYMTKGEEKLDGRKNPRIIENVMESIIGAIYMDGGIESARIFIEKYWFDLIKQQKTIKKDPKTRLQEWLQKNKYNIPEYNTIEQGGTKGNPIFTIEAYVEGLPKISDSAKTKKEAEIGCATKMIKYIKDNIDNKI